VLRYVALVVLATAFVALVACSSGSHSKEAVEGTAVAFYQALSDDPPTAYTFLSADCKEQIGYLDFVATINSYEGFLGEGELEVNDVSIVDQTHDHITATYDVVLKTDGEDIPLTGEINPERPTKFVKEDGRWRFEDCAGFSTPDDGNTNGDGASATPTFEPDSPAAIEADDDPSLPGEFVDLQSIYGGYWGNQDGINTASHMRSAIDYTVQGDLPPAGGPHWGMSACPSDPELAPFLCGPVPWGIYDKPFAAESVVHNMEHSGVIVWYNTQDLAIVAQLEGVVSAYLDQGRYLVMMPFPAMEPETIALTAWGRRDHFPVDDYGDERAQNFIEGHECRFDPEALCGDSPSDPLAGNSA
jgi:hypothetical protein